jgi:hypothetical protein
MRCESQGAGRGRLLIRAHSDNFFDPIILIFLLGLGKACSTRLGSALYQPPHGRGPRSISEFGLEVEPMVRIELTTYGLRNRCSTTELHWPPVTGSRARFHEVVCKIRRERHGDSKTQSPPVRQAERSPRTPTKRMRTTEFEREYGFICLHSFVHLAWFTEKDR